MQRWSAYALALAILVAVQQTLTAGGLQFHLVQLTMSLYWALAIVGLTMLLGYAGQASLGHAAFFALGGYTTAVLTTHDFTVVPDWLPALGAVYAATNPYGVAVFRLSPWLALPAALGLAAGTAWFIGRPILRLRGHYLAMATLAFGFIIYRIVLGTPLLGEADGITDVPPFTVFPGLTITRQISELVPNYYFAGILLLSCTLLLHNLLASRHGRALRALHGSEEAANALGIDTASAKLRVFVISAVYAALAGFFLTHFSAGIAPADAGMMRSVRLLAIVAAGGMGSLWGTLTMGVLLNYLSLRGFFGTLDDLVFGAILIVIMLFFPDGILARLRRLRATRPGTETAA